MKSVHRTYDDKSHSQPHGLPPAELLTHDEIDYTAGEHAKIVDADNDTF